MQDFDLSVVIPLFKCWDNFKQLFPSKVKYYERNGIELVMVVDKTIRQEEVLDFVRAYPFINWKIVASNESPLWQNPAKVFNIGIRQAEKQYVLLMHPDLEFCTDVIYELREKLDSYPDHYAMGQMLIVNSGEETGERILKKYWHALLPYGSIIAKKEDFERIGGYNEHTVAWGNMDEDHLRNRLELAGVRRLFFPDSILICRKDQSSRTASLYKPQTKFPQNMLSEMLLPVEMNVNGATWGKEFNSVVYDWKDHLFAKQQCLDYLSGLKQYDILSDDVFEITYPLIALIPTYNESERIADCLRSVEKYCDGIILLDDGSTDPTYQIAQSDKLLIKAQKQRIEFNDKQNRDILLDIASFFKAEWFIFIDADERFDDRFVDIREIMRRPDIDTIGVWIANLWDSTDTYRVDMEDTNPNSRNGLWLRWRMFRNKGRMQIPVNRKLHFNPVPYRKESRSWISKSLLIHLGYLDNSKRLNKYNFYQKEDRSKILSYGDILYNECQLEHVQNITMADFEV